jgi:hypothetical protein
VRDAKCLCLCLRMFVLSRWATSLRCERTTRHWFQPRRSLKCGKPRFPWTTKMNVESPLVWVDCEMSGLDPRKHRLLEIAVSSGEKRDLTAFQICTGHNNRWQSTKGGRRHRVCHPNWQGTSGFASLILSSFVRTSLLPFLQHGWMVYKSPCKGKYDFLL